MVLGLRVFRVLAGRGLGFAGMMFRNSVWVQGSGACTVTISRTEKHNERMESGDIGFMYKP